MFFFSAVSVSLALSLMFCDGPLLMGLWVLFIALMMSGSFSVSVSTWFALILFLIYVGGMLVMFSYFAAISPNQHVSPWAALMVSGALVVGLVVIKGETFSSFTPAFMSSMAGSQIASVYSSYNVPTLILLGCVLFLALIVVVKVANWSKGALRPWG